MSSSFQSNFAAFHSSVTDASYGKTAEERGLKRDVTSLLFINLDGNASGVALPRCAGLLMMQLAIWSLRYTPTPSPRITAVKASAFAML